MGCFHCGSNLQKIQELCIITAYFNPNQNSRRKELHKEFIHRLSKYTGIQIITIECAFGNLPFELSTNSEQIIRVRSQSKIWLKENLMNIALKKLFSDKKFLKLCKYIAWIDDDIEFIGNDWVSKIKNSLKTFKIVQIFKEALFLDINLKVLEKHTSFGYYYSTKKLKIGPKEYAHPGYGWATTTENLQKMEKLFDYGILGSGDKHMAYAIIGNYLESFPKNLKFNENYKKYLQNWQEKANKIFKQNLGYADLIIKHHWHGSRKNRQHLFRWLLLSKYDYDPSVDVKIELDGHYEMVSKKQKFLEKIEEYFIDRKEDDKEVIDYDDYLDENIPNENKKTKSDNFPQYLSKNKNKIDNDVLSHSQNIIITIPKNDIQKITEKNELSEIMEEIPDECEPQIKWSSKNNYNKEKINFCNPIMKFSPKKNLNHLPTIMKFSPKKDLNQLPPIMKFSPKKNLNQLPPIMKFSPKKNLNQFPLNYSPKKNEQNEGRQFIMYHGTSEEAAILIERNGFQRSIDGMLGPGVYVSRNYHKAKNYIKHPLPVILKLSVNVGKVAIINRQNHPLQKTWHQFGYDSAWVPPNCGMVNSGMEENCVYDPQKIKIIKVYRLYNNELVNY